MGHLLTYRAPTVCHMNTESSLQPIEKKKGVGLEPRKMISQSAEIHSEMVPGGRTQRKDSKDSEEELKGPESAVGTGNGGLPHRTNLMRKQLQRA